MKYLVLPLFITLLLAGCSHNKSKKDPIMKKVNQFAEFELKADLSDLSENQKKMLLLLFDAADIMDELFWLQAYGNKNELLDTITNKELKEFIKINYGPWERLKGDTPFVQGFNEKPKGANFYPADISKNEFYAFTDDLKNSQYSIIRRDESGSLNAIPYSKAYAQQLQKASRLLREASLLTEDEGFRKYLELRSEALLTDNYQPSDMAWMDMKNNLIDFIVGPIEDYEDQLFGRKTSFEAFILLKDKEWSERLNRYATVLPVLQKKLPVTELYKAEVPGSNSELAAYDALYYAGDCNAASKTIAINLPNDEDVQIQKGSRRLQLKNSMQAKFDKILIPIANELIIPEQRKHITFDAFFGNVMFHEVAHGLGMRNTINNKGTVREALKEQYVAIEEGKADVLGLFLVEQLIEMNEWNGDIMDHYVTFLAGIFRSIRFGSSSAHGIANLIRFNYFREQNAFERTSQGLYAVNSEAMHNAIRTLSEKILIIEGNGDNHAAHALIIKYGTLTNELQADLDLINSKGIPVDIVFKQGPGVLGLH